MRSSIVGTVLALSVLSSASTAEADPAAPEYRGEDLFMGLFLDQGPAAGVSPQGPYTGVRWPREEAKALTARMRSLDPTFFGSLKDAVTSGDRLRIMEAADAAGALAVQAAGVTGTGPRDELAAFVVVDKTVLRQQHVVVNQVKYWTGEDPGRTALARERWADDVARLLVK